MAKDYLRGVYDLHTQADTDEYYTAWAATYDEELVRNGYRSPQRCAEALVEFQPLDAPVLDVGCGTGLSGSALSAVGYTDLSGQDVNSEMIEQARERDVYRDLWVADPDDPFPFEVGTYAAMAAIGVIGPGAGPASLLGAALSALDTGGHMVFSYNDLALAATDYSDALESAVATGTADQVFSERGPHIEALDSSSTVFVLRRT